MEATAFFMFLAPPVGMRGRGAQPRMKRRTKNEIKTRRLVATVAMVG